MIWDSIKYGWTTCYWLTIEGLPVVWSEIPLPYVYGGLENDPGLIIDRSSEVGQLVDRDTGMGQGLPLSFSLAQSATSANWLRAPLHSSSIVTDVNATDASGSVQITVADATGFGQWDPIFLGLECFQSNDGLSGDTFTNCARALYGSKPTAHFRGTGSGQLTDRPRIWRGREIRLFAIPVAPDGTPVYTDLEADSTEVFRGYIDQGPSREGAKFSFEALSLDRLLAQPLPGGQSGKILDVDPRFEIHTAFTLYAKLDAKDSGGSSVTGYPFEIQIQPFAALADGDLLSAKEQAFLISAAWDAQIALISGPAVKIVYLTGADYVIDLMGWDSGNKVVTTCYLRLPADSTIRKTILTFGVDGKTASGEKGWTTGIATASNWGPVYKSDGNLEQTFATGVNGMGYCQALAVQLDEPAEAVPTPGFMHIDGKTYAYLASQVVGNIAHLNQLFDSTGHYFTPTASWIGKQAILAFRRDGNPSVLAACLLESTGNLHLRGGYDQFGFGQGYGIPEDAIDLGSFSLLDNQANAYASSVGGSSKSFEDMLSGFLALAQRGIVARPDASGKVRLGIVSTEPGGSGDAYTILDGDLLSYTGDPVANIQRREPITQIKVATSPDPQGTDAGTSYTAQELSGVLDSGGTVLDLTVTTQPGVDIGTKIKAWAASILDQSHTIQAVDLKVVPWLPVTVGDSVRLNVTTPSLWSWKDGTSGYNGCGRCIGAKRDLAGGALTLTLLLEGSQRIEGLSPACRVNAFSPSYSAPTQVDIPIAYLAHMKAALVANGGPIRVLHYQPGGGYEGSGGFLGISAAAKVTVSGTDYTRLTVSDHSGLSIGLNTSTSWLTLPATSTATDYQRFYAHSGDGSMWG